MVVFPEPLPPQMPTKIVTGAETSGRDFDQRNA